MSPILTPDLIRRFARAQGWRVTKTAIYLPPTAADTSTKGYLVPLDDLPTALTLIGGEFDVSGEEMGARLGVCFIADLTSRPSLVEHAELDPARWPPPAA
jgi:hypothetical protein